MNQNSIALCAIAKNENLYLREWVEYYKSIGVSKIFLYDNNDIDGEQFDEVICDYIESKFVQVINKRGIEKESRNWSGDRKNLQDIVYEECYNNNKDSYKWMMFFDIDEFLISPSKKNIQDYLNSEIFDNYDTILVNWEYYGDDNKLYYEPIPVMERFKKKIDTGGATRGFRAGNQCKSIVRCGKKHITIDGNIIIHKFLLEGCRICNSNGESVIELTRPKISNNAFNNLVLNHYITKTIEEYLVRYVGRVDSCSKNCNTFSLNHTLTNFFRFNQDTYQKRNIANSFINRTTSLLTMKEKYKLKYLNPLKQEEERQTLIKKTKEEYEQSKKERVVYVTRFGNDEPLPKIKQKENGIEYVCLTDRDIKSEDWIIYKTPKLSGVRTKDWSNVYCQFHPKQLLQKEYKQYMFIQGEVPENCKALFAKVKYGDMACRATKDCIYDKVNDFVRRLLDNADCPHCDKSYQGSLMITDDTHKELLQNIWHCTHTNVSNRDVWLTCNLLKYKGLVIEL